MVKIKEKVKEIIKYLKDNPRKIFENLTSYLTIFVGILGIIISYGTGLGLSPEVLAYVVTLTAIANRIITYIRITFLKENSPEPSNDTVEEDSFVME